MYAHLLTGKKLYIASIGVLEYLDANYSRSLSIAQQESLPPPLVNVSSSSIYWISHLIFPHNTMLPFLHIITQAGAKVMYFFIAVLYYSILRS